MKLKTGHQQIWFFEKFDEIGKLLAWLTKWGKKGGGAQITNIRNERESITIGSKNIKRIIKKYYQQLYAHTFDSL